MKKPLWFVLLSTLIFLGGVYSNGQTARQIVEKWKVHDPERPMPPVVDPGPVEACGPP